MDNYTLKVPRDVFEEKVKTYNKPFFAPEGPYIAAGGAEIRFSYRCGARRIRILASLGDSDYVMSARPYLERQVMATFNRMVKYPKYDLANLPEAFDVKQVMYSNPEYDARMINYAIAYDMNSAFGFAELGKIPNTDCEYTGNIRRGDVGIRISRGQWIFATTGHGFKCWPLIDWNARAFVNLYFSRKAQAKTPEEKQKAKDFLTHHVGSMKHYNQIIRCWIIWNSNKNIDKYRDENTILMNTDNIISLVARPDIPCGDAIGQFKVLNEGRFAKLNMDYQFYDTGTIKKRGLDRGAREGYDILSPPPKRRRGTSEVSSDGYNFVKGRFKK